MEEFLAYQRDEKATEEVVNEEASDEIDVKDGYDASVALAEQTESAAAAFHKLGDGYEDEGNVRNQIKDYPECFFIMLKKNGEYKVYQDRVFDPEKWEKVDKSYEIDEADEVYYRDMNDIHTSEGTENIVMSNHLWGCEDYSLDDAIVDVLSGTNEYNWPAIDIDFIYNGKIFYSFTL